jgi:transcription antitermination factor NusG
MSGLRCWYAVYTKPNAEYRVARLLQLKGLEVFLPEIPSWKPRRGHRTEPLFPSYVFVRADWSAVPPTTVEWTPGVRRLVAAPPAPRPRPPRRTRGRKRWIRGWRPEERGNSSPQGDSNG